MREAVSEEQQQTRTAAQAADVDHDSAQRDQQMHRKAMERVSRSITELAISKAADAAAKPVALIETARLRKRPSPSRNGIP